MPPGNQPREPAGAARRTGTASAVFHLHTTSSWVYLIWKGNHEPVPLPQTSQDDKEQTRREVFLMIQYILELRQVAATTAYETEFRQRYTPINDFFNEHDVLPEQKKHRFALDAEILFLVHLGQARDAAQARADELGVKITKLLVPIPSNWPHWMQICYAAYFRIAWKLDPEFIYESEAIAHFVVPKSMMPGFQDKTFRTFILVDLGAQVLSLSTFHLATHRTNPSSFHLYSEPNEEKSWSMYNECFSDVLGTMRDTLGVSKANEDADKTTVVLVGAGFQNMNIRKEVEKQVRNQGFLLHNSNDSGLDTTQPSIVALGAAIAIVNASTVEQFMQAARFVVQSSIGTKASSATIWSSGSSRTAQVSISEEDETLIVKCSPLPKTSRASGIDATSFYDFSELKLPRGVYEISMNFPDPSTNGYSVIISYEEMSSPADNGRETQHGSRDYRIYYDHGSRLCFEDLDKSPSREKNDQATTDSEKLEKLLHVTVEVLQARILARTKYRAAKFG